ncbi:hypothetical protein JIN82_02680 [Persicirhabdus sediminis]|uniref:Uncharacterized protein n=1 Tax=Persicirhabdus sediminis TaxID=454144 RepID=A0A8J7MCN9_9BACT|nr:hypothetical protein [Persicirhabdus sediminis]
MNRIFHILITLSLFVLASDKSLGEEASVKLKYIFNVPRGLEKQVAFHHKNGSTEVVDAHKIYKRNHRIGWLMQLRHYDSTGYPDFDYFSGIVPAEFGLQQTAKLIGISEARTLILKQELAFGSAALRKHIKQLLSEQDGADLPATAPESKSEGDEKPKPESEARPQ